MSFAIDFSDGRFEIGKNTLIVGQKKSGKTSLAMTNIFLKFQSEISHLFVVSKDEKYKEITSNLFEENQLPKIFQEIQTINRFEKKMLIIDEIINHNNPIIECILINSHYFNITIVFVSQLGSFNMIIRKYIDIIAIGNEHCHTFVRDLYERFGTIYGDFTYFLNVILGLGKNEFLFIPNGKMNISLIKVNEHWIKYLYSYKMFVRYDILMRIKEGKKKETDELINKVNNMIEELTEIKLKLEK